MPERSHFLSAPRSREALDRDYSPSRFVPSLPAVIADWATRTTAAREAAGPVELLAYGAHPRETIDFYRAATPGGPLLVFIHGGFWKALSRDESGFVAPRWTAAGVNVAVLDYVLAPEATLDAITAQAAAGLRWLVDHAALLGFDAARVVVAGHSAGAHLAAMAALPGTAPPLAGLALVSGVFDLAPITGCYVNEVLGLDAEAARRLSPALMLPARPLPVLVAVGEEEPVAFQEQSRALAWSWRGHGCEGGVMLLPGHNHFSILDDLADPAAPLGQAVARML